MNARPSKDASAAARHNPDFRSPRRDTLIDDVSRELKRRHGGNDVLNRLEAEILVDHYMSVSRSSVEQSVTAERIVSALQATSP